jgi:hypothetical protein
MGRPWGLRSKATTCEEGVALENWCAGVGREAVVAIVLLYASVDRSSDEMEI